MTPTTISLTDDTEVDPEIARDTEPRAAAPWMLRSSVHFALFRLTIYGTVGLASELFFYNLTRMARGTPLLAWAFRFDWRVDPALGLDAVWNTPQVALYGQASLWMFLVYGLCTLLLIEPLYRRLHGLPAPVRGLLYALAILVYEWATGWALLWLTGYRIWFYADAWSLGQMTSAALVPAWIFTGLFAESLYRALRVMEGRVGREEPRALVLTLPGETLHKARRAA